MKQTKAIATIVGILSTTGVITVSPGWGQTSVPMPSMAQQVDEVVNHLVGVMDTSAQAASNPKISRVQMTTCQVQVQDASLAKRDRPVVFLYQEQALAEKLDQPYRQRFLRIAPSRDSKTVESLSFKPEQMQTWAGFCQRPKRDRQITLRDLGTPVCSVWLKRSEDEYLGRTPVDGCPARVRGAVRITNRVRLWTDGMDTWDRGFDAQGRQVWGAESDAYQFRWVQPKS